MSKILRYDIDPANADANGIADDLPTGTSWSLSGDAEWTASVSGDGLAHQLIITTSADETTPQSTLTLTGTDADGNVQTEAVTLPNATTVETTKYWSAVTSATADVATTGTMDIGWVDEIATNLIDFTDWGGYSGNAPTMQIVVTGTIDYTFEVTNEARAAHSSLNFVDSNLADDTASNLAVISPWPVKYGRFVVNSYTDTAEIQFSLVGES